MRRQASTARAGININPVAGLQPGLDQIARSIVLCQNKHQPSRGIATLIPLAASFRAPVLERVRQAGISVETLINLWVVER